jgi:hypothetical protein
MNTSFVKQYLHSEATVGQEALAIFFICVSAVTLLVAHGAILGSITPAISALLLMVALVAWISTASLTVLFQERHLAWYSFGIIGAIALVLFLRSPWSLVGVVLLLLGLFDAQRRAQDEKKLIVEFRPYRIMRRALPILLVALSLFSAIAYVTLALADDFNGETRIPRAMFDVLFTPVEEGLKVFIPSYHEELSVTGTQTAIARDIFRPDALERFGVNAIFETIEKQEGQNVPLKEAVYDSLNNSIASAVSPYRAVLPFVAIIGFFFVFRLLFFLLMWPALGISMIAVKVLVLYNIVSVQERTIKQEEAQLV